MSESTATVPNAERVSRTLEWLLRATCAVMFVGHAWVCWNGQMPIRALLWDEGLMTGIVRSLFGVDWATWVSSPEIDARIEGAIRIQALLFLAYTAAALVPKRHRALGVIYCIASANLAFLAALKFMDAGVGIGQLVEHASQVAAPFILFLFTRNGGWGRATDAVARGSVVLTFVGHGLFAIGISSSSLWLNHPRPGAFTEMTMLCLGLESEAVANAHLLAAGIADFVVAILIFIPGRTAIIALAYMTLWGFLTTLARPWAYFEPTAALDSLNSWLPEALYRAPHFGLPLCLLLLALGKIRAENPAPKAV